MEQSSLETILKGLGACGIETHFDRGSCAFPQATVCYQIPPEKKGGRDNIRGIDPGFEHLKGQGGFGGPQMFWISVLVIRLGVFLVSAHKHLATGCEKEQVCFILEPNNSDCWGGAYPSLTLAAIKWFIGHEGARRISDITVIVPCGLPILNS